MLRFSSSVIQKSLDISVFSTHPVTRSAFHQAEIYLCTKIGPRYGMVVVASKVKGRQIPNNFGRWMAKETWDSLRVFSGGQQCGTIWDVDMFEQNIDVPSIWKYLSAPIMVLVGGSTSLVFLLGLPTTWFFTVLLTLVIPWHRRCLPHLLGFRFYPIMGLTVTFPRKSHRGIVWWLTVIESTWECHCVV